MWLHVHLRTATTRIIVWGLQAAWSHHKLLSDIHNTVDLNIPRERKRTVIIIITVCRYNWKE